MDKDTTKRTNLQNKALHVYCSKVADALNDAGLPMQKVMKVDIDWDAYTVKKELWKWFLGHMRDKTSTTEMTTKDTIAIYENMNRHLAENYQIHVPWPSTEEQAWSLENLEKHWDL